MPFLTDSIQDESIVSANVSISNIYDSNSNGCSDIQDSLQFNNLKILFRLLLDNYIFSVTQT